MNGSKVYSPGAAFGDFRTYKVLNAPGFVIYTEKLKNSDDCWNQGHHKLNAIVAELAMDAPN